MTEQTRWRLILGAESDDRLQELGLAGLSRHETLMDEALAAIYDGTGHGFRYGGKEAGTGKSSPHVARWLADVRGLFPDDVVSVVQNDAIERKGLRQLLFEPETLRRVKPDIDLVATLLALKHKIPDNAKAAARDVVRALVEDVNQRLRSDLQRAVSGALNRMAHSSIPSAAGIDWKRTITRNLKHFNPKLKRIIPERVHFFDRAVKRNKWTVILALDQSGSMADSVIYGAICGSVLASMASLKTHVVAFDTAVVDLTEQCGSDPVDMLFGVQLGGGTDINQCVGYCRQLIEQPAKTIFILLTDLYEGGNQAQLYAQLEALHADGVKVIALTALSDRGTPSYDAASAKRIADMGIPCFACAPQNLPVLLEGALKGHNLSLLAERVNSRR